MKTLISLSLILNLAFAPVIAQAAVFKAAPARISMQAPVAGRASVQAALPGSMALGQAKPVVVRNGVVNLIEVPQIDEPVADPAAIRQEGDDYDRPTQKIWFVYSDQDEKEDAEDALNRLRQELPNANIEFVPQDEVLVMKKDKKGQEHLDAEETFKNIAHGPDLILFPDQDSYEGLRELRDAGYAREIPMGFTGARSISVDVPKADIDLHRLNDSRQFPHRNYMYLSERTVETPAIQAGSHSLKGKRATLEAAVEKGGKDVQKPSKKGDEDMGPLKYFLGYVLWRSKLVDDKETAEIRRKAHALGAYLSKQKTHVLVIDDPEASRVVGLMKQMGYHVGLPVIWNSAYAPADATGINMTVFSGTGEWLRQPQAKTVKVLDSNEWTAAVAQAPALERLPYNFNEVGGPGVVNAERAVRTAMRVSFPLAPTDPDTRIVGAEMSNGNGTYTVADGNGFGHLGESFELKPGVHKVATVWYNSGKGGPFSGVGSDPTKALNLHEYGYTTQYIVKGPGQPTPLGETPGGSMLWMHTRKLDNRPVDKTSISDLLVFFSDLNAEFQKGADQYNFLNNFIEAFRRGRKAFTNCASLVIKSWKKMGARLPNPLIQNPIDGAVNIFALIAREFKENKTGPFDFMISSWDRPYHSAPSHYRIENRPIASPMYHISEKALVDMNFLQRLWRYAAMLRYLPRAWRIPQAADNMADMAGVRIIVEPNSMEAKVYINPQSPLIKIRVADEKIWQIRQERDVNNQRILELDQEVASFMGYEGWRSNPEHVKEKLAKLEDPAQKAQLEAKLAEHSQLEAKNSLYHLDENIQENSQLFFKIELLDPLKRLNTKLDPVRLAYKRVLEMRRQLELGQDFSEEQITELEMFNGKVFRVLSDLADDAIARYGKLLPRTVRMMFTKTSSRDFQELLDVTRKVGEETAAKKTGGKK